MYTDSGANCLGSKPASATATYSVWSWVYNLTLLGLSFLFHKAERKMVRYQAHKVAVTIKCILKGWEQCLGHNVMLLLLSLLYQTKNLDKSLFRNTRALLRDSMILASNLGNKIKNFCGKTTAAHSFKPITMNSRCKYSITLNKNIICTLKILFLDVGHFQSF